jgi:fido (protein-threonine AMPylation protein)
VYHVHDTLFKIIITNQKSLSSFCQPSKLVLFAILVEISTAEENSKSLSPKGFYGILNPRNRDPALLGREAAMSAYQKITYAYTPEEKQLYWNIGIGLQAVDSLKPSKYLVEQQEEEMALAEKEADFSSLRINEYLRKAEFRLHPLALKQIHGFIFKDIESFDAGEYRTDNISKSEPVLLGASVRYEDYQNIEAFLEYDIEKERKAVEKRTSISIEDLTDFIASLWQIHPFKEGNTRAIAVFTIQYLNALSYQFSNEPFEKHAAYFRDALVRASYNDMTRKISPDHSYFNMFFKNVIQGKQHQLKSEDLVIQIKEHEPQD